MEEDLFFALVQANKLKRFYFDNGIDLELPIYLKNKINARYSKVSRIRDRFLYMICRRKYIYFITFTFSDKYINKCDRTKKDLIKNSLNGIEDGLYILNIDYGDKHEREHYHCLLASDMLFAEKEEDMYFRLTYPCFSDVRRVSFEDRGFDKVCKYINKLSNHACKSSTRDKQIYYNFKGYSGIKDKGYRNIIKLYDKNSVYR